MANYYLHVTPTEKKPFYWRSVQKFGGIRIHINLNLLGLISGDKPRTENVVDAAEYDFRITGIPKIALQPFVRKRGREYIADPLRKNLKNFLNDPLHNGRTMDLSVPVLTEKVNPGDNGGGWFRRKEIDSAFHGGFDFMPNDIDGELKVCAAREGVIAGIEKKRNGAVVIKHNEGGAEFLTIYKHINTKSSKLKKDDTVVRGEFLARMNNSGNNHLHFMTAVKVSSFTLDGFTFTDEWFAIDSFGVYDYYNNRTDTSNYNYIPDVTGCLNYKIKKAVHPIHWREPLADSIQTMKETNFVKIEMLQVRVRKNGSGPGLDIKERNQALIWLEGHRKYFFVPFDSDNITLELKMLDLLRDAFNTGRKVKLEYFTKNKNKVISAAWVLA